MEDRTEYVTSSLPRDPMIDTTQLMLLGSIEGQTFLSWGHCVIGEQ